MIDTFETEDGLTLAFADDGPRDAPAVLCLAGITRNMGDFDTLAARLSARYRVIRLDSRGRGRSDHDPDWQNYNVAVEARDALACLDHLGIAQAAVIGTSRGGLLAMMMAAMAPGRLSGVLLNDVGPDLDTAALLRIADYIGVHPGYADIEAATDDLVRTQAARFPGVPREVWRDHAERGFRQTSEGLALRYDPRLRDAFMAQMEALNDAEPPDLWPLFDAMAGIPVTVLRGANSDLLSTGGAAKMKARRPDIDLVEVADRGHVPFLDEPESTAAIDRFLEAATA